jgi:DNA polymerase-3 subunit alpha
VVAKTGALVHLHVHTEFSVLDGLGTIEEYVERAKQHGMPALSITDHGNLCGAPAFYHACRKADIEPIIGEEFYFVPDADHRPAKGEDYERYHVVILAKGERGYQILSELSTEAYRHFYYKPLIGREQLEDLGDDAQHLVVLSGCAASIISKAVRAGDMRAARQELVWWKEVFPHFYIELQHHDTEFDKQLNEGLLALARRYQLPWVVTNDPHYAVEEDCDYHDALLAIQTAADIDDPNRFRFDGSGYHLRSRPEMAKAFRSYGNEVWKPGAAETLRIARACRTRIRAWESRTWHIPKYPDADGGSYRFLERLAVRRLKKLGLWDSAEYRDRMDHELSVIKQTGIADFLLITRDCIEWAKQQGIPVGPGRGSVCGTLVGYLIGLHKIDPVRYNLMFERFLNPARPRMPDIDTDFGQRRRDELFDYVKAKYGQDNVVHVCAYARMNNKAAFQSLARAHGISYPDRIRISKLMTEADEEEDLLPEEVRQAYPELAGQLMRLSGVKRAIQTHPAGVIIADDDFRIRELVPEMWIPNTKRWVGMYDLDAVEEMGLMKQDFLVLRTLDTIDDCLQLVFERTGERLDPDSWVPDEEEHDDAVYKMLAEGRTAGVFQMEGPTNQRGCLDVKPECFEDIVSITSLYRTGAISAGFPKIFIKNRQAGKRRIEYAHPLLKPILRDTWGVVLYQEQVMEIGRSLAGFTMEQVDDIKEAIKHKKSTLMQSMKPVFIAGAAHHHNIDRETSTKIWKMIEGYSGYGYNRSHAVAYSFITYQTARLKALYPLEFYTALLRTVEVDHKRDAYMREAAEAGIRILAPDVNASGERTTVDGDAIRFGLADIAGIGPKQAAKLVEGRSEAPYASLAAVEAAARNKGVLRALEDAGALASLGVAENPDRQEDLLGWCFHDRMEPYRRKYRHDVEFPDEDGGFVHLIGEIFKIERGRTKNGKPYMTWKLRWSPSQQWDVRLWAETEKHWDLKKGSIVSIRGEWESRWLNISCGNPRMIKVIKRAS